MTLRSFVPPVVKDALRPAHTFVKLAREGSLWMPENARLALSSAFAKDANERAGYSDDDHLRAAAEWLVRAQDASPSGGISGRYLVGRGWTSAYPETTGYTIPTLF